MITALLTYALLAYAKSLDPIVSEGAKTLSAHFWLFSLSASILTDIALIRLLWRI